MWASTVMAAATSASTVGLRPMLSTMGCVWESASGCPASTSTRAQLQQHAQLSGLTSGFVWVAMHRSLYTHVCKPRCSPALQSLYALIRPPLSQPFRPPQPSYLSIPSAITNQSSHSVGSQLSRSSSRCPDGSASCHAECLGSEVWLSPLTTSMYKA